MHLDICLTARSRRSENGMDADLSLSYDGACLA